MKFLSVCSGIEAASVAWTPLGWEAIGFSEIEPFPCAVLKHHYPDVPNFGDMTRYHDWPDTLRPDLVCGGTPCQAFSLAGLRQGLADPRGNLSLVFLGILERFRPRWVVWENVPGVFSSLSHDAPDIVPPEDPVDLELDGQEVGTFDDYDSEELHALQCFLAGLSELGYGVSYRTFDAQYVRVESHPRAVPQRRRRVFVVGHLGDWRRSAAVLFDPESLRGDSPPCRRPGQDVAGTLTRAALDGSSPCGGDGREGLLVAGSGNRQAVPAGGGVAGASGTLREQPLGERATEDVASTLDCRAGRSGETTFHTSGGLVACEVAPTLSASAQGGGGLGTDFDCDGGLVAGTVSAKWSKGSGGPSGDECHNLVAATLDASFGKLQGCSGQDLKHGHSHLVVAPITTNVYSDRVSEEANLIVAHTLRGEGFDASEGGTGRGIPLVPTMAFDCKASGQNGFGINEDVAPTLRAMGHAHSHHNAGGQVAVVTGFSGRARGDDGRGYEREPHVTGDVAGTLDTVKPPCVAIAPGIGFTIHGTDKTSSIATETEVAGCLRTKPPGSVENSSTTVVLSPVAFAQNQLGEVRTGDIFGTLATNSNPSGRSTPMIAAEEAVRRLTPRECERLQGFPDQYTRVPWRGKPPEECPDGPRYRGLGNSWAVNCPRLIGERIDELERILL